MQRHRAGFTVIEMLIAVVIGSILTTVALSRISGAQTRIAVRGAQSTYAAIHYRARVHGIEKGRNVMLHVETLGDSVWIEDNGTVLEKIRFGDDNIDMRIRSPSTLTEYTLCFTPRGYTDTNCNTTTSTWTRMFMRQGADSLGMWIFPLGQVTLDQ